nr:hypothetical protein [Tanacetum cinerariifolium]
MAELPRCDELRRVVNSLEWEAMFILYCRRAISEDQRLSMEINALRMALDVSAGRFVPEKMVEFMKESQDKDTQSLMKL